MDSKFALLLVCACGVAFAATWKFMDEAPPALRPAAAAAGAATEAPIFKNCEEVRAKGLAPLMAGRPGYNRDLDPDGTGLACPPI